MYVACLTACLLTFADASNEAQSLKAGAARIDITPPTGYAMWGYASRHDAPSTGVMDRLLARAVVLATGTKRLAIVSLDLGRAPTRSSMARIRAAVKQKAKIDHVMLVASHTHNGPVLELHDWPTAKNSYVRKLENKLVKVMAEATEKLRPARLGAAAAEIPFNRNRHSKREDRPVDRELIVVRIESVDGSSSGEAKPIAVLVNFAAHPTMISRRVHKFSADFPGVMAQIVEEKTSAVCLFLQGAAGDLSPDTLRGETPQAFGKALAKRVIELSKDVKCDFRKRPLQVRERDFRFAPRLDLNNPIIHLALSQAFFEGIISFYEREYREGVRPHLTTVLLGDEIGFVGVSGEFFCGHAQSLKRRARLKHLLFLGYCNDYQQYFPTIQAASEGGYGTQLYIAPAPIGAGERIINQALIDLYDFRNDDSSGK